MLRQRGGFTLLEMLAVLAIIGLLAGLSTQLVRPAAPHLRLEGAARGLCAALRATRARAISANEEATLVLDLARKSYSSPSVRETLLPAEMRIEISIAKGQRDFGGNAGLKFFPSGASTGGDITLEIGNNRATIQVNWLSGATRCDVS
ncbi:GspH/FimT family pseudopilin [Methylocystis bryophila]|uniref:Type II secretion system protein H n=1 Tax=Methylocystis bryophila TaxID=655015 RepID=A0A1W6MXF0_9HYPH|nr:GspH/FimT family pseudopilin [Methylocystis bryophila]ARN82219.1 type II secretion system protein GspH [Methylocystis bryophila]